MSHKLVTIVVLVKLVNLFKCDMNLRLELDSFNNPNGLKADNKFCYDNDSTNNMKKCSTFFKFCLKTVGEDGCISELETQIIGENVITKEQFKLTTNSIEFPISIEQLFKRSELKELYLEIEAYNDLKVKELISKWTLSNLIGEKMNEWVRFNKVNSNLNQQFTFDYKVQCSANYYGTFCEKRKHFDIV